MDIKKKIRLFDFTCRIVNNFWGFGFSVLEKFTVNRSKNMTSILGFKAHSMQKWFSIQTFNSSCPRNLKHFGNHKEGAKKMRAHFSSSNHFFMTILV